MDLFTEQPTFADDWGIPAPRPRGRPRLDDEDKARRGTLKPSRSTYVVQGEAAIVVPARDYVGIADQYAADVGAGVIPACTWVKLAIARQAGDRARAAADPAWGYTWDPSYGIAACHFLEHLPHVEGAWTTATIRLEPWQVWCVLTLYAWRQRADLARRRFTNMYLELARKGAKSTLMAGLMLYHIVREDEPGAMGVCGATTGIQARIVFGIAQKMVRRSRWLRARGVRAYANAIVTDDATIKPINAKASTQDGLNPSCIVLDEAHAQTFALHDVLKSAQGARRNPLLLCPTTAGYNLLSVGYALRTGLTKVLQGVVTVDHLFGLIYTLDEGDDWRDETTWIKACPMIGVTPALEWVRQYCAEAQATPGLEAEFRVKICSQWSNAASTWLSLTQWDAGADPTLTIDQFVGQPCWIGGDLAQRDDLAAIAYVFERAGILYVFVDFYLPALVVQERARTIPAYRDWTDRGILRLTDGNMIDYGRIEADVRAACRRFDVRSAVFDQFGSYGLVGALFNDGIPARAEAKNAKSVTLPALELEARVKAGRLRHDGNPCLRWQISNAVVTRRIDDTILPKKDHADSPNKIDGVDAVIQAIGGLVRDQVRQPDYQIVIV